MSTLKELGICKRAAAAAAVNQSSLGRQSIRGFSSDNPPPPSDNNLPPLSPDRPRSFSPTLDDSDRLPSVSQVVASGLSQSYRVPDLSSFGERQLKRVKLATGSERDYRMICATTNIHERQNLETLAIFELLDKVEEVNSLLKAAKGQEFKKNSEVNAEIRNFSRAFLLNPDLNFYSADSSLKVDVVNAMYKERISGLPPSNASNAVCKKLEAVIGHQLSVDRNKIKDLVHHHLLFRLNSAQALQLLATLDSDSDEEGTDLATITTGLISSWHLEILVTFQVLWRMALIRYQLIKSRGTPDDFWDGIDKSLHDCQKEEAGTLVFALQEIFKADVEKFGNIPSEIHLEEDIGPHSPAWIQRINKMAPEVDHPKLVNKGKKVLKRKRAVMEKDDDIVGDGA